MDGAVGTSEPDADEQGLWRRWRHERDAPAREALLARHLPYARVVAAMVYTHRVHNDIDFDDYLQLARIGLLEAFDRYDPDSGAQFRTFASRRMRGAVLDGLARLTERHQQLAQRRRLLAERTASVAQTAIDETDGEQPDSSANGDANAPDGRTAQERGRGDLFQYLAEVGMGLAVGFMLEGTGMFSPGDETGGTAPNASYRAIELQQTRQQLNALVAQLPAQERRVIQLHYQQGHAFEEIARELQLTKGRISQVHKKALSTLRELLAARNACDRSF